MSKIYKVMIVEDHEINLKLITEILELDGFEVYPCADAENAMVMLKSVTPDLILMDVGLPGMDGIEFTRILKKDLSTQAIKIIALTAFAMDSDKENAFAAGCDGYITKPFDTRKISETLYGILL